MKKYFGLQKVILALTTLTLVGLSSCNDQNFDWDEAHATQQYEKFTNVFIKEFGKPAEGHQWGFDAAQLALSGGVESSTSSTRGSYKQQMVENWPGGFAKYGKPNDITYKEHFEVLAWFSNHRVTWTNSPCLISSDGSSRTLIKSTAYEIDNSQPGYGSLVNDFNRNNGVLGDAIIGTQLNFTAGWVQTVAQYEESSKLYSCSPDRSKGKDCPSRKIVYGYNSPTGEVFLYDGKYVQSDESGTAIPGGKVTDENPDNIYFYKVLFDEKIVLYKDENNNIYKERADPDQGDKYVHYDNNSFNTTTNSPGATLSSNVDLQFYHSDLVKSSKMNKVVYWDEDIKKYNHLLDWNNNTDAYGWGRQPSTDKGGIYEQYGKAYSHGQNATLITNSNVNQFAYEDSEGGDGKLHDKYIMVYLKGDDYEGWYIGFDHEVYNPGGFNLNQNAFADGICNDWIIKVSAAGNASYENVRIMCEDLGGNYGKSTTDIDYNDIVLDITNKIENCGNKETVTLTLRAAGGTLPLIVTYKDGDWAQETILFETHEMFGTNCAWKEKLFWAVGNYKWSIVDYKTMYNTQENTDYAPTRTFVLYRGGYPPEHTPKWHTLQINNSFNIMNIGVKVYRHGLDDYVRYPQHSEEPSSADWISLENMEQEAPLMICVPNTTIWLKERHKIDDGYPNFKDWVKDPSFEFWNTSVSTVNDTHLCK